MPVFNKEIWPGYMLVVEVADTVLVEVEVVMASLMKPSQHTVRPSISSVQVADT
jgi:precorrin-6B methylase 1